MNPSHFGTLLACVINNVRPDDLPYLEGQSEQVTKSAAFGRQIAQAVAESYARSHLAGSAAQLLYDDIAKSASWSEYHEEMTGVALVAMAKMNEQLEESIKQAGIADTLKGVFATTGSLVPEAVEWSTLGGAAIGGGLGSLAWALNRDATGDDAEAKDKQTKIDHYNQLAQEINEELKNRPPKHLAGALQQRQLY